MLKSGRQPWLAAHNHWSKKPETVFRRLRERRWCYPKSLHTRQEQKAKVDAGWAGVGAGYVRAGEEEAAWKLAS
jgi:hypothetical protein